MILLIFSDQRRSGCSNMRHCLLLSTIYDNAWSEFSLNSTDWIIINKLFPINIGWVCVLITYYVYFVFECLQSSHNMIYSKNNKSNGVFPYNYHWISEIHRKQNKCKTWILLVLFIIMTTCPVGLWNNSIFIINFLQYIDIIAFYRGDIIINVVGRCSSKTCLIFDIYHHFHLNNSVSMHILGLIDVYWCIIII